LPNRRKILDRLQEGVESVTQTNSEKVTKKIQKSAEKTVEKVKESLNKK
jgi:hypothetical protein